MNGSSQYHCLYLKNELSKRCQRNPKYSLRSFARALDVDAGLLSKILNGQRRMSLKMAEQVARSLDLGPEEKSLFIDSVVEEKTQSKPKKDRLDKTKEIDHDLFNIISELHHYAILELTKTNDFESSSRSIAKKLGLTQIETELAIDRLLRAGLLTHKDGELRKSHRNLTTKNKSVTTPALKKHQLQSLKLASESLMNDPIGKRNMSSMTMAIDPSKVELAKTLIQDFMDQLSEVLTSGEPKQVYQLGVCLYPLQRRN